MARPLTFLILAFFLSGAVPAAASSVDAWLAELRRDALAQGIRADIFDAATEDFMIDDEVIELDNKQPEKKIDFETYRQRVLTPEMIEQARAELSYHKKIFDAVEQRYNVPREYLVALWAIETRFGENMGGHAVVDSLLTLAYDGRRADFFRAEALKALHILNNGDITLSEFVGSWAGAMGQCQFMPSTYVAYAVDADGDGHRNIWSSYDDVFASMANYLTEIGWQRDLPWGLPVRVTRPVPERMVGREFSQPLSAWHTQGVYPLAGTWPQTSARASLIQPDGPEGESFLVFGNFNVLMKWNRSTFFATTVSLLAHEISS